ncbi:hypothetical protein PISMIDRAFT_12078 [Pisolithus microcarpus 441]|uniref:Uncharacterized protein n=1 Tax=Pisolithus microcarpus 441 TaxID=765257 RepID=A0A0C9ZH13_9AGAM|nr:hypothetical protein PISMIDRAFT_12078 [Pisolithus microcarpus 441]
MVQKIVEGKDHHHIWKAEWHGRELSIFEKSECCKLALENFYSVLEQFLP